MKNKRRGQRTQWYQYKGLDESPVMPTHPEILKRLAVEYPQDIKDEYRLDSGDAADYRKENLMKPSEVIMERGWIQEEYEGENSAVCLVGALQHACHMDADQPACDDRCTGKADRAYDALGVATSDDPVTWNDVPGRTVAQVIALLQEFETEFESDAVQPIDAADFRNAREHMRSL